MSERDVYRDTPLRLLGYANEVGEAFRSLVPVKLVHLSYGIASLYVLADTTDKAVKTYKKSADEKNRGCKVMVATVDTLIWQSFASIIIPGFTINRVCALSQFMLNRATILPGVTTKLIATGIGLACIPIIVNPIDNFVHYAMDNSVRKIEIC